MTDWREVVARALDATARCAAFFEGECDGLDGCRACLEIAARATCDALAGEMDKRAEGKEREVERYAAERRWNSAADADLLRMGYEDIAAEMRGEL